MDWPTAAVACFALLVVLVVALAGVSAWRRVAEEGLAIKRLNAERMARLDGMNPKKNGSRTKKKSKNEDDEDEDEDDDWPVPEEFEPVARGIAHANGIDYDSARDGNVAEQMKLQQLMMALAGQGQQPFQGNAAAAPSADTL